MNYYRAREQDALPKLIFELVATSEEELQAVGLNDDPLVVTEEQLTDEEHEDYISYQFGICHVRINNGELEARPGEEIDAQELAHKAAQNTKDTAAWLDDFEVKSFSYAGKLFPLTAGARIVYNAIIAAEPASHTLYTLDGTYTLLSANIAAFAAAMNAKILETSASSGPAPAAE